MDLKKILFLFFLNILILSLNAQDTSIIQQKNEILDLKIKLLDSRLELLNEKLSDLEKTPKLLNKKIGEIDSLIILFNELKNDNFTILNKIKQEKSGLEKDTLKKIYKSGITLNPYRLFEGTFAMSYEKFFKGKMSFKASLMYTYVTKNGMGGNYFSNQKFDETVYVDGSNYNYNSEMFTGFGLIVSTHHYLKRNLKENNLLTGFYASPQIMYRKIWIIGKAYDYTLDVPVEKEITKGLDIIRFGSTIGGKISISDIFFIDIYAGGVMRLSKYANESRITMYKKWNNIDYTGVLPVVGINVGIFI